MIFQNWKDVHPGDCLLVKDVMTRQFTFVIVISVKTIDARVHVIFLSKRNEILDAINHKNHLIDDDQWSKVLPT